MPITLPKLDNRTFDDLMAEGLEIIRRVAPEWTNHNESDPGITLIQLFAYVAEMLIYRLDKVTDRNLEAFLMLINGTQWKLEKPLGEEIRTSVAGLRKTSRAVTAEDFERLVLEQFKREVKRAHAIPQRNLEKDTEATVVKKSNDTMTDPGASASASEQSGFPLLVSTNDRLYIGTTQSYAGTFRGIRFTFARQAKQACGLTYRYLNREGNWVGIDEHARQLTDYTEGWTEDGLIAFAIPNDWEKMTLPEWQKPDEKRYWIEISATAVAAPPLDSLVEIERVEIEMDESSHVSVVVIGPESKPIADDQRQKILDYLNDHCLLTTRVRVAEPRWRQLRVKARLDLKRDAKESEVRKAANDRLGQFFHPLTGGAGGSGWPLGRNVYASEIYDLLDRIAGVDYVTGVRFIAGGPESQTVTLGADELVQFISQDEDLEIISPLSGEEKK